MYNSDMASRVTKASKAAKQDYALPKIELGDGASVVDLEDILEESELVGYEASTRAHNDTLKRLFNKEQLDLKALVMRRIRRGIKPNISPDELTRLELTSWYNDTLSDNEIAARFAVSGLGKLLLEDD